MTDPDSTRDRPTFLERIHRAFNHAEQAVRCYAALATGRMEAWGQRNVRHAVRVVLLLVCVATGAILTLSGLADLLEQKLFGGFPGSGRICVGLIILAAAVVVFQVARKKDGR